MAYWCGMLCNMKNEVKNIPLLMFEGGGAHFGADCPKQYCMMAEGKSSMCYTYNLRLW